MSRERTIVDLMTGLFAPFFPMPTWRPWVLAARTIFGLTDGLEPEDAQFIRTCTGRTELPRDPADRLALVVGRRGGKSRFVSFLSVYLACFRDYSHVLSPGERGIVMIICPDRRQARTCYRYAAAFIESVPMLAAMVESKTKEAIHLNNNISIEIATASPKTVRGYTVVACILDECAFLPTDPDSAEPDAELVAALEPAMATVSGALLMLISSPHACRGELWNAYHDHYGVEGDRFLVWRADSKTMNPSMSDAVIARAYEKDPVIAASEFGAEFRSDLEAFVSREVLHSVTCIDRHELPPVQGVRYVAFCDPSGGAADSMTMAIAHRDSRCHRVVVDVVREQKAPFDPDVCVSNFAETLKKYRIAEVRGDYYGGNWPTARFRAFGIRYVPADQPKSELYRSLIPILMTGAVELPDHPVLRSQLLALERRVAKSGRESIDHPRGQRDDVANAVAGVAVIAQHTAQPTIAVIQSAPDHSWMDPYFDGRVRHSRGPEPETFRLVREARRQRQAQRVADALERPRDPNAETWIPPNV